MGGAEKVVDFRQHGLQGEIAGAFPVTRIRGGTIFPASLLGLGFIPITRERFDMILDQPVFFQKGVQALMGVLAGEEFRKRVKNLGSYDFRDAGKILYSKP